MEKMKIYDAVRDVPETARRKITGGRLNGKTDINPMWRIKTLTAQFGPCGIGWSVEILEHWLTPGANNEVAAHVKIALRIRDDAGDWSQPIIGIGGSMFVANERNGANTSDECFKMAYTDAISVACKMLGIGADVYWDADKTKYSPTPANPSAAQTSAPTASPDAQTAQRSATAANPKRRITDHDLDAATVVNGKHVCDELLKWMYGHWVNAGYPEEFDAKARLLQYYEADDEVAQRFAELFNSYKIARNGK